MQQKEFEMSIRQVLPELTGVDSLVIENTGLSKLNFHGMRYQGRIMFDFAHTSDQFASGMVTLMCIPNDQITIPSLLTEADLNDSNSFIIATKAWMIFNHAAATEVGGYNTTFDFEFAPKTSRSCMKGGKIVGQITNTAPTVDVVVTHLLSTFETF